MICVYFRSIFKGWEASEHSQAKEFIEDYIWIELIGLKSCPLFQVFSDYRITLRLENKNQLL